MSNTSLIGSVHGQPEYHNHVPVFNLTSLLAIVPFFYIIPTIFVMVYILALYRKARIMMNTSTMDPNMFMLIMFYFLFNTLFFLGDYLRLNLPSSGLITSFCAKSEPNWIHKIIVIYAYTGDYGTISCPFLATIIRCVMILSPHNHSKYCRHIMRFFVIPFIILVPISLAMINFIPDCYCKQLNSPFPFGSLIISEGPQFTYINVLIHLTFSYITFWCHIILFIVMFFKLRTSSNESNTSIRTKKLAKKAELSLTLAISSCIVPFITNSILSFTYIFNPSNWYYLLFLRIVGNDYETIMMPWVLFFTHPLFFRKKKVSRLTVNTGNLVLSSTNNTPRNSSQMF